MPFEKHKYDDYIREVYRRRAGKDFDETSPQFEGSYNALVKELTPDFAYFDDIQKYRGSSYYDTLAANPYLQGRSKGYSPTGLESLGDTLLEIGTLGIAGRPFESSGRQRYMEELNQQKNQYLSENVDKMRQESYDSAPESTARLKQAGLNPDLNGGQGVSPGQAAENDQPAGQIPLPDQSGAVMQAASIPFTLVNGIMSLYQSFQGAHAQNLANSAQEIANNDSAMEFALSSLAQSYVEKNPDKENIDLSDISTLLDESSKLDYSGYSRSTQKLINKFFGAYKDNVRNGKMPLGLEKRIAELRAIATKENWNAANIQSNPLYDDDFRQMVLGIYSYFGDLPNLLLQLQMEASTLESSYGAEYYGDLSGSKAASAQNSANELSSESNEHQKALIKTMAEIDKVFHDVETKLKGFANSGKRGSVFGLLGLLLIPTLKNQVYNGININFPHLPSLNLSRKNVSVQNSTYNR